jgi:hypothetical protein
MSPEFNLDMSDAFSKKRKWSSAALLAGNLDCEDIVGIASKVIFSDAL